MKYSYSDFWRCLRYTSYFRSTPLLPVVLDHRLSHVDSDVDFPLDLFDHSCHSLLRPNSVRLRVYGTEGIQLERSTFRIRVSSTYSLCVKYQWTCLPRDFGLFLHSSYLSHLPLSFPLVVVLEPLMFVNPRLFSWVSVSSFIFCIVVYPVPFSPLTEQVLLLPHLLSLVLFRRHTIDVPVNRSTPVFRPTVPRVPSPYSCYHSSSFTVPRSLFVELVAQNPLLCTRSTISFSSPGTFCYFTS